jgi:hypothetical protein
LHPNKSNTIELQFAFIPLTIVEVSLQTCMMFFNQAQFYKFTT